MSGSQLLRLLAQVTFEVLVEGIQEDVLDGQGVAVFAIELSAALGLADVQPVGGTIAGAPKTRLLHKGFQQNRSVAVAILPILRQLFDHTGENTRGQVRTANPGENQEASVVNHPMQVVLSLLSRPTDESVSRARCPRHGTETQNRQQVRTAEDPISDLSTRQRLVFQVVKALDQLVPQR